MTSVDVRRATVHFEQQGKGAPCVLCEVSLTVPSGTWLGLIGANGAGKSTLLRSIAGLIPFEGEIFLGDWSVTDLDRRNAARLVALVPQSPFIPRSMTVTDYLLMGRTPFIPYLGTESASDLRAVGRVLEELELEHLAARLLGSLSGGELQRAVLGRALAQEAPILLLDEPTSALDIGHQQQVLELVDSLRAANELTVISAMHDLTLAGQFADSLLLLDQGRTAASGSAREVLSESAISRYFGAQVRVIHEPDGSVLVVPTRPSAPGVRGPVPLEVAQDG